MAFSAVKNCANYSKFFIGNRSSLRNLITKSIFTYDKINTGTFTRNFVSLNKRRGTDYFRCVSSRKMLCNVNKCSYLHTKGDQELAAFLADEIKNETRSRESETKVPKLEGFECKLTGAEVELTKKLEGETIVITANVNDSVDAEETTMDPNETKEPQDAEMKSKPDFTISIRKGNKTFCFECCFNHNASEEEAEAYNDSFEITEVSIFEREANEYTYRVSGEIMDGYLYDLLMNYLEERGINNDFADRMIAFFTNYEHELYISHLKAMQSFVEM